MIVSLSLTIYLICGQPSQAQAEIGGIVRHYDIARNEDGDIQLKDPRHEHAAFLAGVEREMEKRNMIRYIVNVEEGCT